MKIAFIAFLIGLGLSACKNQNPSFSIRDVDGDQVQVIQYDQISDSSQLKLSYIATNLNLIILETGEECLVSSSEYFVSDKYILSIHPFEKILIFSGDGKFIRQIARSGKGPKEFQRAIVAVDEERDILYVADDNKSYFMSWDLLTGNYTGEIPCPHKGRLKNLLVNEEGNLIVAPVIGHFPSGDFYMWEQDLEGNIIREIKAPHQDTYRDSQAKLLHANGNGYNYIPYGSDTVFSANSESLIRTWYVDFGKQNGKLAGKPGEKSFTYKFETERYFCGRVYTLNSIETTKVNGGTSTRTTGKSEFLIFDKKTNKTHLNETIIDDLTGADFNPFGLHQQANEIVYIPLNAVDLIEHAEKELNNADIEMSVRTRLMKILDEIDIEDNPVLITGKLKK